MTRTTDRHQNSSSAPVNHSNRVRLGVAGLDDILHGGLTPNRLYLVEGNPGSGKTTLAMQFLLEGVRAGESGLYVTLSETQEELRAVAHNHGWSLEGMNICELIPSEEALSGDQQYTMFHPSEVELGETTKMVLDEVKRSKPTRVVIDSLSEMRLLSQNPLRYRRQILALKQFFIGRKCTVIFLDDKTAEISEKQLHSLAHGVIELEQLVPLYGAERRRLRVIKMRGQAFRGGYHDFRIQSGGLEVYPRIVAAEHAQDQEHQPIQSGSPELDSLIGGGIDRATSTLIIGPAGSGKSSLSTMYALAAAKRGEPVAMFLFDETLETFLTRSESLGWDVRQYIDSGLIAIKTIDPAELSPGEFGHFVRQAAERGVKLLVIDSLNGYLNSMPEESYLTSQLHELLMFLNQMGVATLLILAQQGVMGSMSQPVDASYLADSVILLRYFEAHGAVRQAISVMKKRSGKHERTIRELHMGHGGVKIGQPLHQFQGVLTGVPTFVAHNGVQLMSEADAKN